VTDATKKRTSAYELAIVCLRLLEHLEQTVDASGVHSTDALREEVLPRIERVLRSGR